MTQIEIQGLEEEVTDLKQLMGPKPSVHMSENDKAVQHLCSVVHDLKHQVESYKHDILIYKSLKNNYHEKVEQITQDLEREKGRNYHLEHELEESETKHRKTERENKELGCIMFGEGRRGSYY